MVVRYKCKICGFTLLEIDNPATIQDFDYKRELGKRYLIIRGGMKRVLCPRCYADLLKSEVVKIRIKPSKRGKRIMKKYGRKIDAIEIDVSEVE